MNKKEHALWVDPNNGIDELNAELKKGWKVKATIANNVAPASSGELPFAGSILVILEEPLDRPPCG